MKRGRSYEVSLRGMVDDEDSLVNTGSHFRFEDDENQVVDVVDDEVDENQVVDVVDEIPKILKMGFHHGNLAHGFVDDPTLQKMLNNFDTLVYDIKERLATQHFKNDKLWDKDKYVCTLSCTGCNNDEFPLFKVKVGQGKGLKDIGVVLNNQKNPCTSYDELHKKVCRAKAFVLFCKEPEMFFNK